MNASEWTDAQLASGARSRTCSAASSSAAAVPRRVGSTTMLESGSSGSWARRSSACERSVTIRMRSGGHQRQQPIDRLLDQRALAAQAQQLLGPSAAAERPQAGALAAGQDGD